MAAEVGRDHVQGDSRTKVREVRGRSWITGRITCPDSKEAARRRLLSERVLRVTLLERGVDRVELGVQVAAKAVDRNNDRNRNARCDQAIFNGRRATFIGKEICKHSLID